MARRSVLFTPGDRPEMLRAAPDSGADVLVADLEDGVPPENRETAREHVRELLCDPAYDPDAEVCVRVGPDPGADAAVLCGNETPRFDALMVPKTAAPADVTVATEPFPPAGLEPPVLALVETAAGVLNAEAIASVDATDALCFGAEDLAADLGATPSDGRSEVCHARQHVLLAARAAAVDAVDAVVTAVDDQSAVRADAARACELGYDGKLAIHPAQVDPIHEAFMPAAERVDWARRVLAARDRSDGGVFTVDGEMIDAPLVAQAERVLARHDPADSRQS